MGIPPKLKEFIESHRVSHSAVTDPDEQLHLDSVGFIRLVSFMESELAIRIEDDEIDLKNFDTMRTLGAFLASKAERDAG